MFTVTKAIIIPFAHSVANHPGSCKNIHGHTWKFEVTLQAQKPNALGFVVDFAELKKFILKPVDDLLDHSLALSSFAWDESRNAIRDLGRALRAVDTYRAGPAHELAGACNAGVTGGLKVAVMPFEPTSENFCYWLADVANIALAKGLSDKGRVSLHSVRVYETENAVASFVV